MAHRGGPPAIATVTAEVVVSAPRLVPSAKSYSAGDAVLLLALSSMWGLSFLFIEISLRELAPLWIVVGRTGVGGLVLLTLLAIRRTGLPNRLRTWGHLLILGSVNNAAPWAAIAWAQQSLPSGLTALLMAVVPTSTLVVSALVGLERVTRRRLLGLVLALGGVAAIVLGDLDEPGRVLAVLVVVTATLAYAAGAVYAKSFVSGTVAPLPLATGQVMCATAVSVPVALAVEGAPPALTTLGGATLTSVFLLGALGTGFAFFVFYTLIARVGATNTTMVTYLIPLVAIVAGAIVLDERLGVPALVGGALIVLGIWLAQRSTVAASAVPVSEAGVTADHSATDGTHQDLR